MNRKRFNKCARTERVVCTGTDAIVYVGREKRVLSRFVCFFFFFFQVAAEIRKSRRSKESKKAINGILSFYLFENSVHNGIIAYLLNGTFFASHYLKKLRGFILCN